MNSQNLGELASDQKIQNIFHAFGYSIPVGKDGRRMWPTKFKREMAKQMMSGKLTVGDVQKTCRVSDKTAYRWKSDFQTPTKKAAKRRAQSAFVEGKRFQGSYAQKLVMAFFRRRFELA